MVRKDYLAAIDADRLDELPSGAYAKGFIRAYANYLGLDPVPFVRVYESQCEDPSAELSSFRMEPVRVPHAAHPRAWRIASGVAIMLLIALGLIGAFKSGDEPADPSPAVADLAFLPSAEDVQAPNVLGAVVKIEVTSSKTWVGIKLDGETGFEGFLNAGETKTFKAKDTVYLVLGNPGVVKISANGIDLGYPSGDTYRGTFTPDTAELPVSQAQ